MKAPTTQRQTQADTLSTQQHHSKIRLQSQLTKH